MILSSADIIRILGGDPVIRQEARLSIVDGKPGFGYDEYVYIYVDRYPSVDEFEATWTIWVVDGGSDVLDIVLNTMTRLLPKFDFNGKSYTTTEFKNRDTVVRPAEEIALEKVAEATGSIEQRFAALSASLSERISRVSDGRDGADGIQGPPGRPGRDGRDGADLVATDANLEDLKNVEEGIAKEDGQVLTWRDGKWTNLFVPQIISSISGGGGGGTVINKLDDIGDVDVPSPSDGYVLAFNAATSNWEAVAAPPADISGNSIDDLSDVDTSTVAPVVEEPLVWDGTNWVPGQHVSVTSVKLDTANLASPALGQLEWEQDENTAVLGIDGNVHLHLGHDQFAWCRNGTGSTITAGTAVMFAGTLGASGRLLVAPMVANGTQPGYVFLGIAAESIAPGADGNIISYGKLKGINTLGYSEGAILWCDPAVPGGLTATEPSAPNLKLPIAAVISSKSNGTLMVRWSTGDRLKDLHDVEASAPTDGQALVWSDANSRWQPGNVSGGSGIPEAPQDNNYYVRQNGAWVNLAAAIDAINGRVIDGGVVT